MKNKRQEMIGSASGLRLQLLTKQERGKIIAEECTEKNGYQTVSSRKPQESSDSRGIWASKNLEESNDM